MLGMYRISRKTSETDPKKILRIVKRNVKKLFCGAIVTADSTKKPETFQIHIKLPEEDYFQTDILLILQLDKENNAIEIGQKVVDPFEVETFWRTGGEDDSKFKLLAALTKGLPDVPSPQRRRSIYANL